MLNILTHVPSPSLQECELTFVESKPINIEKAAREHKNYCRVLEQCGARVITLDVNRLLPDSVFVEDPVVVFDEVAILTSMGVESRRREGSALEIFFRHYRDVKHISLPAKIEGGDVLKIGRSVFVGQSSRTNSAGIEALATIIEPLGYNVIPVRVNGCLHLKTGCTALDKESVVLNPQWVDVAPFQAYRLIETLPQEPFGANILPINDTICMNAAFPKTIDVIRSLGYNVITIDIAEFIKAEAGLTCMCVPFISDITESYPAFPHSADRT